MPTKNPFPKACKGFVNAPGASLLGVFGGYGGKTSARVTALATGPAVGPGGAFVVHAGDDGAISRWEVETGAKRDDIGGKTGEVLSLAVSPDGSLLLVGRERQAGAKRLLLWEIGAKAPAALDPGGSRADVVSVAFGADGRRAIAVSGENGGELCIFDVATRSLERSVELGADIAQAHDLVARADVAWVSASGDESIVGAWDLASGKEIARLADDFGGEDPRLALSPSGERLLTVTHSRSLLWDLASRSIIAEGAGGFCGAFASEQCLVVAEVRGLVEWNGEARRLLGASARHVVAPSEARIVTGHAGLACVDAETGAERWNTRGTAAVVSVVLASDGVARWADRMGDVREAPLPLEPFVAPAPDPLMTGRESRFFPGEPRFAQTVAFLPGPADRAVVLQASGSVDVFDQAGASRSLQALAPMYQSVIQLLPGNPAPALAVDAAGRRAFGFIPGPAVLELGEGRGPEPVPTPDRFYPINGVAISPDGRRALGCSGAGAALWDLETRTLSTLVLVDTPGPASLAAFVAELPWLVLARPDIIGIWDLDTGACLRKAKALDIAALTVTPDGARVFFADNSAVYAWSDSGPPTLIADLASAKDRPWAVAVRGDRLLVGTKKGELLVFILHAGHR